jgi:hypothetical protein
MAAIADLACAQTLVLATYDSMRVAATARVSLGDV